MLSHVGCDYVVTSVTFYHSAVVDVTQSRSVHSVEHDPCCPDPTKLSADECKAVHYGLCSPLLKLPAFSVPPAPTASPPLTPKGTSPKGSSTPNSPVTPKGTGPTIAELLGAAVPFARGTPTTVNSPTIQRPASPVTSTPFTGQLVPSQSKAMSPPSAVPSKVDMEILDPVSLLASNLEDQLEALVNTFVAQDKVRLAARKQVGMAGGSAFKPSPANKQISPIKKYDKKIKDDRSSGEESTSSLPNETSQTHKSKLGGSVSPDRGLFGLEGKPFNTFGFHMEDFLHERSSSPSFKSSILPNLTPSPEYQQTGVKAQINKFTSKEKDTLLSSPTNSLERRQASKSKVSEPFQSPPASTVLTLDALQELLLNASSDLVTQTVPAYSSNQNSQVSYSDQAKYNVAPLSPAVQKPHDSNFVPFYVNEACQEHDELPRHLQLDPSQNIPSLYTKQNQDYVQSAVDYAKTRIQNVHNTLRDDRKPKVVKNGHLVSDAKTKWETLPQQSWSEPSHLVTADMEAEVMSLQKGGGHKRALSMEGLMDCPSIPHPKLTTAQKQHIKERSLSPTDRHHSHVPIRPFLTKGSVAERVLLFECCPDRALERTQQGGNKSKPNLISTWRPGGSDVQTKAHSAVEKESRGGSLRRALRSGGKREQIPRFHYPDGKPQTPSEVEAHLKKVAAVFAGLNEGRAAREEFGIITKACGLPLYWKLPLFLAARGDKKSSVTCEAFLEYWRRVVNSCHDEASKFVNVLSRGKRNFLVSDDFFPMMQDVIDSHAGLTFLKEATEFHSRYIHTVIARIFYCVNRSWSGKITATELRKSNFLQVLSTLEEEEDINQVTDYFSYEHFYVIYCKFWELDKDHDLYIDHNDLKMHSGGALSTRIIQRIFSGAVTRGPKQKEGKMSYTEFVWFLISEEDKRHPRSIEYWFRCMDVDGDGFLSMYELEFFYQEQLQRLDALGIETLPFTDCLCQMLDIIKPAVEGRVSLADLKRCRMTPIFFDTFFNLEKYLDHEQRDPFASSHREHEGVDGGPEMSDWDRFAADEYELLVAEESAHEQPDELIYEEYEEEPVSAFEKLARIQSKSSNKHSEDEEYDYAETDDYHY